MSFEISLCFIILEAGGKPSTRFPPGGLVELSDPEIWILIILTLRWLSAQSQSQHHPASQSQKWPDHPSDEKQIQRIGWIKNWPPKFHIEPYLWSLFRAPPEFSLGESCFLLVSHGCRNTKYHWQLIRKPGFWLKSSSAIDFYDPPKFHIGVYLWWVFRAPPELSLGESSLKIDFVDGKKYLGCFLLSKYHELWNFTMSDYTFVTFHEKWD